MDKHKHGIAVLFRTSNRVLFRIFSSMLFGMLSGMQRRVLSGVLCGRLSKRLSGVLSEVLSRGLSRGLSRELSGVLCKTLVMCVMIATVMFSVCPAAYAEEETGTGMDELIDAQAGSETEEIGRQVDKYAGSGLSELIEGYDPNEIVKSIAKGNTKADFTSIWGKVANLFLKEIRTNINILLRVLVIVMICAVLNNLRVSFLNESVGELAFFVSYIVLVTALAASFKEVFALGTTIVDDMVKFMYATSPLLVTLLVSGGNIVTGGVIQPAVVLAVEAAAVIMKNVFIPLILIATVIAIIDNLSEKIKITRIAELLRRICTWGIGIMLTVITAIMAIQGTVSAVADGITGKSVKFAINSIPVVGSYLSDATDTVLGCTLLIRNAAGLAAVLGVLGICLMPVLKIGALVLIYRVAGIIAEPVSDKRISKIFDEVGKSLVQVFAIVVAVAFMFVITIAAIIGASNISAMIR